MNFYEELDKEFKNAELNGKITSVPEELKPTPNDFEDLDRKVLERTEENRRMLFLSEMYARNEMPCETRIMMGNVYTDEEWEERSTRVLNAELPGKEKSLIKKLK